jgi:DNA primase
MHEHGFAETVAPLGTAFTETQGMLLRRFAESVALVFDGDEAGRKAARAAHAVTAKAGLIARVAVLPRGKDPDEVLRDPSGREWLQERIKHAPAIVEWLIEDTAAHTADNTPARIAALRSLAPVLVTVTDSLEREVYIEQTVRVLHLNERQVRQAMKEAETAARAERHNPFAQRSMTARVGRDEPFRKRVADENSANERGENASAQTARKPDSVSAATAESIDALLRHPALLATDAVEDLLTLLDVAFAQPLVAEAREQWLSRGQLDGPTLLALAPTEKARAWITERLVPAGDVETQDEKFEQALQDSIARLRAVRDQDSARVLKIESAKARAEGDEDSELRLLRQKHLIDKQRLNAKKNRGSA